MMGKFLVWLLPVKLVMTLRYQESKLLQIICKTESVFIYFNVNTYQQNFFSIE